MAIDPFLPHFVCPAQGEECYVVRGRRLGASVEISLSRDLLQRRGGLDEYTPTEVMAVRRFEHHLASTYMAYANRLEDAARYAARGDLGYTVDDAAVGPRVDVSLVARLLTESGELRTEVSHRHRFEDPDTHAALVQAAEKAEELRGLARELNENWTSLRHARLQEIQAEYERADAQAEAARQLQRIVESEAE